MIDINESKVVEIREGRQAGRQAGSMGTATHARNVTLWSYRVILQVRVGSNWIQSLAHGVIEKLSPW